MKEQLKKIDNKWVRLAVLIVVFVNTGFTTVGTPLLPFSNEEIVVGLTFAADAAAMTWAYWKNNSFTFAAKVADDHLKQMKEGK